MKLALSIIGLLIAIVLVKAAVAPKQYKIERSIVINAAMEKIFPYVNSPKKMNEWNPWLKSDPNAKLTYDGPEEGVGAKSAWDGNRSMGSGNSEIIQSVPGLIRTKLEFIKPMKGSAIADYTFTKEGIATKVTWSMEGENHFLSRIMCMFMNMDKMIGGTFEQGLEKLKKMMETN